MPLFGKIVVIRRDGNDGAQYPLTTRTCIFGRNADCDIRVQLPNVAKEHCRIEVDSDGKIFLVNLCPVYPTLLNKKPVMERVPVQHLDVFTVTDRSFRVEFPPGSPSRKSRPSTDSLPLIQPTGAVKSESIPEPQVVQASTPMVKDEKSWLGFSTKTEYGAVEKESSSGKSTPKEKTPTAKTRTPGHLVRTPLLKGNGVSPALRSSTKSKAKSPILVRRGIHSPVVGTGVRRGIHSPVVGTGVRRGVYSPVVGTGIRRGIHSPVVGTGVRRGINSPVVGQRTGNSKTGESRSKTPMSSSSLARRSSALFADEIAELKMALTKQKGQTPARTSVLKTPGGSALFHSTLSMAKTPTTSGNKIKTPSVTPGVLSKIASTPKLKLNSASSLKTPIVTPFAKTPVTLKSRGLLTKTSSVHRIKKVLTPSPRGKTQKRRSSMIPDTAKKTPLRNTVPQTDSKDEALDAQETVDSVLDASFGDRISHETTSFSDEESPGRSLSSAKTDRRKIASPRISSPSGRPTRRKSLSPVARSPGSPLTHSKSQSPQWGQAKSSPQKILQSPEILNKSRRLSSSSKAGAAVNSPPLHISSPAGNLIQSQDHAEDGDSILESSLIDKSLDEASSSDGKSHSSRSTPAEGRARRMSRSIGISSPGGRRARVKSHSPKSHSPETPISLVSPGSSLTRSKSQGLSRGSAKSQHAPRGSAKRLSENVTTQALSRRSYGRMSVEAKQSLSQASDLNVPHVQVETVQSNVAASFPDTASDEILSPTGKKSMCPMLSPSEANSCRKSPNSLTKSPCSLTKSPTSLIKSPSSVTKSPVALTKSLSSLTRSKRQSPLGSSREMSAEKKLQSSQMSPVDEDKVKRKSQGAFESPAGTPGRMSHTPITTSTQSQSQSPLKSQTAHRSLQHADSLPLDSVTHSKSQSPKWSPGAASVRRRSQYLDASIPSKAQDNTPAVIDDCFLESYDQQFSPLILEMDDLDETADSPKQTAPISGPAPKGGSDPGSLRSAVGRLRRKSQPLLEESEDEIFGIKSAEEDVDTLEELDLSVRESSFLSPSQGLKRSGSPLKGCPHKKRCVSFGPDMSPELFDRSLPVATPLKRGATPQRKSISVALVEIQQKPLLKARRSMVSTGEAILQKLPLETKSGKSPKDLKVVEKLSKGVGQNPVPETLAVLDAEAFVATDLESSLPVATPFRRQTKPRSASVVEAAVYLKSLRKNRRATLATAGVIPEAPLDELPEKSARSSKILGKESTLVGVNAAVGADAKVLIASETPILISSIFSPVAVGSSTGSKINKIFTSGTGTRRLSRPLKTPPAAENTTSNENSPAVETPASKGKTPQLRESLPPRSSLPLTNMQNSSVLHEERDPFAFESSPEASPAKSTPKPTGQNRRSRSTEVNTSVSEELATRLVLESGKKKLLSKSQEDITTPKRLVLESGKKKLLSKSQEDITTPKRLVLESGKKKMLSKSQEDITTPKVPLDFAVAGTANSVVKSARSVERNAVKDVSQEQEHELREMPTAVPLEGPRSAGRRSSKPKPETPVESTQSSPKSIGRRSSRFFDKEQLGEYSPELTPASGKLSVRRSTSSPRLSSPQTYGKASTSEQVFGSEGKRSKSSDSAAKTPRSSVNRGQVRSEEKSKTKTPDVKMIGKSPAGGLALVAGDGVPAPRRFSDRKSSSPFKRPFGSEPRKLHISQIGNLFRLSPEDARKAVHAKIMSGKMISERNIDLSSLNPLRFYKSPAVEAFTGKRLKVTPGRAVALRAVYGKSAVPPLAELQVSRKASELSRVDGSEVVDKNAKSLPAEKTRYSKVQQRKKLAAIQVAAKKNLEKKTGFAVKKKQTKVLLLKRVGRRSVGQVVKRILPGKKRNLQTKSSKMGKKSLPNIAENVILEVPFEKDQTTAELSKSPSHSVLLTPNGPGEMSVSPWSSPVRVSSGKRRSGDKSVISDDVSSRPSSLSFAGLKRSVTSPGERNSPNVSGINLSVEYSPQLIEVNQPTKTYEVKDSPRLSGSRKLVRTPKGQRSPKLVGIRNLMKTSKAQKSPKLSGVRDMLKTPKEQKSPNLSGIKNMVKTPKAQKSPKLSGVKELVKTPKDQKSPKLAGLRNMVKTPKAQKSPKLSGVRDLLKTPKDQKSPKLIGIRSMVKSPKVQKSPKLSGVRELLKSPKDQTSPQLSGVRNLMQTPKVPISPDLIGVRTLVESPRQLRTPPVLSGLNELVEGPASQTSPQPSSIRETVKTPKTQQSAKAEDIRKSLKSPKHERSPRVGDVKPLVKTPKLRQMKLSGPRDLVRNSREILSPELEGVPERFQSPFVQQSAKKRRVKSPEVTESSQFVAKLSSPEASATKQVAQKGKSAKKTLKSVVAELNLKLESASLEGVTPVTPVIRPRKGASRATTEKVKDMTQSSLENVHSDESVGKDEQTVTAKTRKRKISEPHERPAARKRRLAGETVDTSAGKDGMELESAVKRGRGSKKVAAETLPIPSEVTATVSSTGDRPRKGKGKVITALKDENLHAMSAAPSPRLAGNRNSRSQRAKTIQVEKVTTDEDVLTAVEETIKLGNRRQARSSKKDLPVELAAMSEDKTKSNPRVKGKGKAAQPETEVFVKEAVTENVKVSILPAMEKSGGRQQGRAKKNAIKEVVQDAAVVNKAERKTRARGKTITTEVEVTTAVQVTAEDNAKVSSVAVKAGSRQRNRAMDDANKELNEQSTAIVIGPEGKGRASAKGKTKQTGVKEVEVKASVQETEKLGSRRQTGASKKNISEETDIKTESVVGKTGRKVSGRGKSRIASVEAVEKTVKPNVRNKKRAADDDIVESSAADDEKVDMKQPVRGRKAKSGVDKDKEKEGATAHKAVLAADNKGTGEKLNQTQDAIVAPVRRGRKGAVVKPTSSGAEDVTEVVQSSRKRKAKTVEDFVVTETRKARIHIEATAAETVKKVSSPKPLKGRSTKASAGVAFKKGSNIPANDNLIAADNEPKETPARGRNKRKAEENRVSSATDEKIKENSSEKKQGKNSSNKAKSGDSSEAPKNKHTVTSRRQKTVEQASDEVDQANSLQPKGRARKVKFDVPPTPGVDTLEKAALSTVRGHSGTSKRESEKEPARKGKARISRSVSTLKDTTPPLAKRALQASRK